MEAVRPNNPGALIAATAILAILAGTVLLQQTAVSKEKHQRASIPQGSSTSRNFSLKGEKAIDDAIKACSVEIDNGSIDCQVGTDGKSRVHWEVVPHDGANAELMDVHLTEADGTLRVSDEWHGASWARKPEVRVTVWLPEHTDLELALGSGDVSTALNGKLVAEVGNGELKLQGAPSQVEVEMGNGHVTGTAMLAQGQSSVQLGNGHIELQLLKGSDVKVDATTAVGKVETNGLSGQVSNNWVGSSYSGQVGNGTAAFELEVGHGDLKIGITDA